MFHYNELPQGYFRGMPVHTLIPKGPDGSRQEAWDRHLLSRRFLVAVISGTNLLQWLMKGFFDGCNEPAVSIKCCKSLEQCYSTLYFANSQM
jgi:hypothetical protein